MVEKIRSSSVSCVFTKSTARTLDMQMGLEPKSRKDGRMRTDGAEVNEKVSTMLLFKFGCSRSGELMRT